MAEQDSKPTSEESGKQQKEVHPAENASAPLTASISGRKMLPLGLGLLALLVGCYWWGNQPGNPNQQASVATPAITNTRPAQSSAALTRVASSLAQVHDPTATATTPTATALIVALVPTEIPLPTVTPTIVPSPVATRTVELKGNATLRIQLNNENFESNGQPVIIDFEPRSYVLGGDTMMKEDEWCMQVGPTGLVFDLTYTLQPITGNLQVGGELQLFDGFCGTLGNLGNLLSTVPLNVIIPSGSTAQLSPALQVKGSLLGLPNLLDISTGVFLEMSIRNPNPR
jgi:hypothetical protein